MKLTKKQQKRLITLVIALIIFGLGFLSETLGLNDFSSVNQPMVLNPGTYEVINVEDGDTLTVNMNGAEERVRFIGVDTPEVRDPRKPVQCFGRAASEFTRNLIGSSAVRLEADPENTNRDRYDRLLRYVYLPDSTFVNAEIVRQGYGFAYTSFPFTRKQEFKELENQAMEQNLGLWAGCETGFDKNGYRTINADPNP